MKEKDDDEWMGSPPDYNLTGIKIDLFKEPPICDDPPYTAVHVTSTKKGRDAKVKNKKNKKHQYHLKRNDYNPQTGDYIPNALKRQEDNRLRAERRQNTPEKRKLKNYKRKHRKMLDMPSPIL